MDDKKEILSEEELIEVHGGSERKDEALLRKYGKKLNEKIKTTDHGLKTNNKC